MLQFWNGSTDLTQNRIRSCGKAIWIEKLVVLNSELSLLNHFGLTLCCDKIVMVLVSIFEYMDFWYGNQDNKHGFGILTSLYRPASAGIVRLQSGNPFQQPLIDPRYLTEDVDIWRLLDGESVMYCILWGSSFCSQILDFVFILLQSWSCFASTLHRPFAWPRFGKTEMEQQQRMHSLPPNHSDQTLLSVHHPPKNKLDKAYVGKWNSFKTSNLTRPMLENETVSKRPKNLCFRNSTSAEVLWYWSFQRVWGQIVGQTSKPTVWSPLVWFRWLLAVSYPSWGHLRKSPKQHL